MEKIIWWRIDLQIFDDRNYKPLGESHSDSDSEPMPGTSRGQMNTSGGVSNVSVWEGVAAQIYFLKQTQKQIFSKHNCFDQCNKCFLFNMLKFHSN